MRTLIIVGVSLLVGCVHPVTLKPPLDPTDLGKATRCDWEDEVPVYCIPDPMRATIDLNTLNDLLNRLDQCHSNEFNRRKL